MGLTPEERSKLLSEMKGKYVFVKGNKKWYRLGPFQGSRLEILEALTGLSKTELRFGGYNASPSVNGSDSRTDKQVEIL